MRTLQVYNYEKQIPPSDQSDHSICYNYDLNTYTGFRRGGGMNKPIYVGTCYACTVHACTSGVYAAPRTRTHVRDAARSSDWSMQSDVT